MKRIWLFIAALIAAGGCNKTEKPSGPPAKPKPIVWSGQDSGYGAKAENQTDNHDP
jgi:hypothetical protein